MPATRRRPVVVPPWLGATAGLIVALFGVLLVVMGTREIRGARALAEHGQVAPARAFDWSAVTQSGRTSHELHYEFSIAGAAYSASDATGRAGLWAEVPEDEWQRSRATGALAVRYLPEDPWVNEPAAGNPGAMGDHYAALVLGVVALSVGLLLTLASLLRRSRQGPRISPR